MTNFVQGPPWWLAMIMIIGVIYLVIMIWRRWPYRPTVGQDLFQDLWCVFKPMFWHFAAILAAILLVSAHHGPWKIFFFLLLVETVLLYVLRIVLIYRWGRRRGGNVLVLELLVALILLPQLSGLIMFVEFLLLKLVNLI